MPQQRSYRLGREAKFYYGAAGSRATSELTNVKDLTLNLETGEADVTTRGSSDWEETVATRKKGSIEFEMVDDPNDPGFNAFQAAFFGSTPIACLILNCEGGHGLDADFAVTNFSRKEPLDEAISVSVTIKPTRSTRAPAWV